MKIVVSDKWRLVSDKQRLVSDKWRLVSDKQRRERAAERSGVASHADCRHVRRQRSGAKRKIL